MIGADRLAGSDAVAVIPARDEAARLPRAVASLRRAGVAVLVVANGCLDATAAVARDAGAAVIERPALQGGVGEARRIGMAAILDRAPRARIVMTTDADCTLGAGTMTALRRALIQADAVFGRVEPDPDEFAALPLHVRRHGILEDRHDALLAEIEGIGAALAWDPPRRHNQSPGALIAFRPGAYAATGGFVPLRCHEDRTMAETLVARGLRVARPWDAAVIASCRTTGRAAGGMADTIARRAVSDLDPETTRLRDACAALEGRRDALRAAAT
ncbi:glycosyltransferase [Jannaschia sp. LMIT008]|uniref:glycosyltransferase n=1 Tax=Jannaschia maritima TaxID=3032585 RepID=UPI002810D837|nr:glycosyltransferase [Jannaschia sp. LMIT008]